jgi:pantoate--beta-alanine ligase
MYPEGHATFVDVEGLSALWEGTSRPGHFRGVATIVAKLLRAVRPSRAYFGEKDYQQLQVVRRMVADLLLDVEVVACPIVREPDGLALSSRNVRLLGEDRARACALFTALMAAQDEVANGRTGGEHLCTVMRRTIGSFPGVEVDYVAVVDPVTLDPVQDVRSGARALVAVRVGGIRLIDNLALVPLLADGGHGNPLI